jgi:hypothetical protein
MIKKINFLILAILSLASCNKPSMLTSLPITSTVVVENIIMPVSTPAVISVPTQSLIPTNTPTPVVAQHCPQIGGKEAALQDIATGTILLDNGKSNPLALLDLQTQIEYPLPAQTKPPKNVIYNGSAVSPNGNMLAYFEMLGNESGETLSEKLWIVSTHGEVLASAIFNRTDLWNERWLDNERLLFYSSQTRKDGTVILFNPFTRAQQNVMNDLPGLYTSDDFRDYKWRVEYSPDLKWVVYLGKTNESGIGPIVWDVTTKQILWQTLTVGKNFDKPVWSPIGDEIAVFGDSLYIIDRNGQATTILNSNPSNFILNLSWSPDGLHIAFWNSYKLMVYNQQTGQITDYCIENKYPISPIWSPSSQQIIVSSDLYEGPVLVDIQKNTVHRLMSIPDVTYPLGWMNSVP